MTAQRTVLALLTLTACSDKVEPAPTEIERLHIALPTGVTAYYRHDDFTWLDESGVVRFDVPATAVPALEANLPCPLSAVETKESEAHLDFMRAPQEWFTPNIAARYRHFETQCHKNDLYISLKIDVTNPQKHTVYIFWLTGPDERDVHDASRTTNEPVRAVQ